MDLNPVAWFVVKNELACTDPEEVRKFFDQIEAEVKPVIQPFYVTECPRGHGAAGFDSLAPKTQPMTSQCRPTSIRSLSAGRAKAVPL